MRVSKWLSGHTESLVGKRVAVSGATGGLGQALCRHLASLGATLVLLDRNMEKSRALAEKLRAAYPDLSVSHIQVDMEQIDTVRRAAEELKREPLHYLILNAGAYSIPRHKTSTGYDNVYQINFISPYYLVRALLPHLAAHGGRAVAVGSIAHRYSVSDPADVDFSGRSRASLVYGNAKRHLMCALWGLAQTCDAPVTVVHPGISQTGITAHYPKVIYALIKFPMRVIFMKPRKACLCVLEGMARPAPAGHWIGPWLFDVWGVPKQKRVRRIGEEERTRLAALAEQIASDIDGQ